MQFPVGTLEGLEGARAQGREILPRRRFSTQSWPLLRYERRDGLRFHDWRGIPLARQCVGFGGVESHGQIECAFRCGQPVGFVVFAGTVVLKIQIERAVRVVLEGHPTADRKPIENISNLEAIGIVERDGPECVRWWRCPLFEVNRIAVRSVKRLA